jgi:hypothetical protein
MLELSDETIKSWKANAESMFQIRCKPIIFQIWDSFCLKHLLLLLLFFFFFFGKCLYFIQNVFGANVNKSKVKYLDKLKRNSQRVDYSAVATTLTMKRSIVCTVTGVATQLVR